MEEPEKRKVQGRTKEVLMRKVIGLFLLGISLVFAKGFESFSHSFFGVYGKGASVMGRVDGSALEVWIYPYKVLHDLKFAVIVNGEEKNPYVSIYTYRISPEHFTRTYLGDTWRIDEEIYPALEEPIAYIVYDIYTMSDMELEFSFKPDLSPMWPACLGGRFSYWDKKGYFVLSEASWKNFAIVGFPEGKKEGKLPAHKLPGGKLKYRVELKKGEHILVIPITAGAGKLQDILKFFSEKRNAYQVALLERKGFIADFMKKHLRITTPDPRFNEGLKWAMFNLNFAFVRNPYLGEGLVAGYGLSGEGERPGFAWFFGGDGIINSLAVVNYGDFEGARREIEFLFKYQRKDGKIPHEISQGAGFVNWFRNYGFPYFHGDTTLYFALLLDYYVKWTGDKLLLRKYYGKIYRLMEWLLNADADDDGIVDTAKAGTGASETGPLRQAMKTDILLAGLSIKAWEAMNNIWKILRSRRNLILSQKYLKRAREKFEQLFWDQNLQYYVYAIKKDGKIKETTIWPAIPMRFGAIKEERGKVAAETIATPWLSTDWGTRFLSSRSNYYDPVSYNNGAVWPFLTGFASLALYNYGNPYHAFSLLQANANIFGDFDYGAATELLSGDIYRPLDQSVPNQIWSSGTTLSAFVEGLLGFSPNALTRTINLTPRIPLYWKNLKAENLRAGNGSIDIIYRRSWNLVKYRIKAHNLQGYTLNFAPDIPALSKELYINGTPASTNGPVKIDSNELILDISYKLNGFVFPFVRINPGPGDFSRTPIIQSFELKETGFNLSLWGKKLNGIFILTDKKFSCSGAKILRIKTLKKVLVDFGDEWKNVKLECQFK